MDIHVYFHNEPPSGELAQISRQIHQLKEFIMASKQEFLDFIAALTAEVGNISTAVDALLAAQTAAGSTTPEEDAATAALKTALDSLQAKATTPPAA